MRQIAHRQQRTHLLWIDLGSNKKGKNPPHVIIPPEFRNKTNDAAIKTFSSVLFSFFFGIFGKLSFGDVLLLLSANRRAKLKQGGVNCSLLVVDRVASSGKQHL